MAIPFLKSKPPARGRADDPLALFEAESEFSLHDGSLEDSAEIVSPEGADDPRPASGRTSGVLTLETVLGRGTPVFWPEAVAIIEATCTALVTAEGTELPAPEPSDILLTAEGIIQVRGGGRRADSVQRIARTLHALTSGQVVPAPLRLFTTKWIASDGSPAIAEFAGELAYFARPEGAQLIREVYQRCVAAARLAATSPTPAKQAETAPPKPPVQPKQVDRRRRGALVVVAFSVVFAGAISLLFYRPPAGDANSSDLLANLMARAAEFARSLGDVRTQLGDLTAQLSAHLASGVDEPTSARPAPTAGAPSGRGRGSVRAVRGGAARPAVRAVTSPPPVVSLPPAVTTAAGSLFSGSLLEPAGAVTADAEPASPAVAVPAVVDPDAIYSNADEGVNPPKMVYPQLPPAPLVLGPSNNVNMMEIVIGDDGSVEKVKLVSPPRRMTDMMLLSGAKSWKFAPALKDGLPVRYRIAVSWATTP